MSEHPHLANALRDLGTRFGVTAADLAPDELFQLVEAVRRVENPFAEVNADAIGFPVKVCEGTYFWKLSAGAYAWLGDYAARWWGGERDEKRYFWAMAYAAANSRNKDAFVGLDTEAAAYRAIRRSVMRMAATPGEIAVALDKILGRVDDDDDPRRRRGNLVRKATDWSHIAARLESESGICADEWLWGRSAVYTMKAYDDLAAFARRYVAAGGAGGDRLMDELDDAMNALARTVARIGRRVKAEREAGQQAEA